MFNKIVSYLWLYIIYFVFVRYRWIETVGDDDIILPGAKLIDGLTGRSDIRVIHLDHGDVSGHNRALKNSEYQKRYVFIQEGLKFNSGEESERKKTNWSNYKLNEFEKKMEESAG